MDGNRVKEIENAPLVGERHTIATAKEGISFEESQPNYNGWSVVYDEKTMDGNRVKEIENALLVGENHTIATAKEGVSYEESQRNYNDWSVLYDETLETLGRRSPIAVADYVASSFNRDEYSSVKILDVGAGTGSVGQELKRHGFVHIDALEPNQCMMNKAKERCVYEHYFMDYLNDGPSSFEKDSYDVITGCGIFAESAHVPCEALNEMIRIVKPDGYIILAARVSVLKRAGDANRLESFMEQLERDKKWKMIAREYFICNEAIKQQGVIWKFQVV